MVLVIPATSFCYCFNGLSGRSPALLRCLIEITVLQVLLGFPKKYVALSPVKLLLKH